MKKVFAVVVFWFITLFGPFLLILLDAFSPWGLDTGSLYYLILTVTAQAMSAAIACYVLMEWLGDINGRFVGVNAIIASVILGGLTLIAANSVKEAISFGLAMIVFIAQARDCFKRQAAAEKKESSREP